VDLIVGGWKLTKERVGIKHRKEKEDKQVNEEKGGKERKKRIMRYRNRSESTRYMGGKNGG